MESLGRSAGSGQPLAPYRALLVIEDAKDCHKAREVEKLLDLRVGADQIYGTPTLARALEAADEDAQAGAANMSHLFKVDDEMVVTLIDELGDGVPDFRGRVDVDLAWQVDDANISLGCAGIDLDYVFVDLSHPLIRFCGAIARTKYYVHREDEWNLQLRVLEDPEIRRGPPCVPLACLIAAKKKPCAGARFVL